MPAYIWVTALDNTQPNQVLIGATSAASATNRRDAINAKPETAGIGFSLPTQENAAFNASLSGLVVTVTAKQPGTVGNGYGLTETEANFSWSGAHPTGGTDGVTTPLTTGVLGAGAGQGLLYTRGSADVATAAVPAGGTSLLVQYYRLGADHIVLEDSALVAARAIIEHGTGKVQMVMTDTGNTDPVAGAAEAKQALTKYGVLPTSVRLVTYNAVGILAGQWLTLAVVSPLIASALITGSWQVHDVSATYMPGQGRMLFTLGLTSDTVATMVSFWEALTGSN